MPGSIALGRVSGIAINLHFSWFLIAGLIAFSLNAQFEVAHPEWGGTVTWSVALGTAVLFFATLLAHELAHSFVAQARGLPVRSITLFALGGVATIAKDATNAKTEFLVAIVGPLVSFAIGGACIAAAQTLGWSVSDGAAGVAGSVLGWLGSINIVLAVFNLLPGYPLDGGRILRAMLWSLYGDVERATRAAARVGQAVAAIFIGWGLVQFVLGGFGGLWLALIGWFLMMAARASYAESTLNESLRDVRVADVMTQECPAVDPRMHVKDLVEEVLLRTGRRCVLVKSDGRLMGLITTQEIRNLERSRWSETSAESVMRPMEALRTVPPSAPLGDALKTMVREDLNQLPVVSDGRLEGMISRAHVLQLLESRAELRAR